MAVGNPDDERLERCLKRVNAEISGACALELACGSRASRRRHGSETRVPGDSLVLLGIHRSGDIAIVPVASWGTSRQQLLSLSKSIAECAMLLGLGTSIYAVSGQSPP